MDESSLEEVRRVFEQWAVYEKIIQNGYMRHPELIRLLGDWFRDSPEPLRIVDLGCGDAWLASQAFAQAPIARYLGIDLSDEAITRARRNLSDWAERVELINGDLFAESRKRRTGSADVVLLSYSLHHFLREEKQLALAEARRLLDPAGQLIVFDVVLSENETRDEFLRRLETEMSTRWTALTASQLSIGLEHIWASDFPETESWMSETVAALGLHCVRPLPRDDFFGGWIYRIQ